LQRQSFIDIVHMSIGNADQDLTIVVRMAGEAGHVR
jgi:hypothetical protein